MKKIQKQSELTEEQRQNMEQIKIKAEIRKLNRYKKTPYFEEAREQSIKDLSKSISFGMTFLLSFFLAGLTGYYVGVYFIGLTFSQSMIIAAIFIMGTIITQTTLYIIKQNRDDKIQAWKLKQKQKQSKKTKSTINIPHNINFKNNKINFCTNDNANKSKID